ncbi:MAG: DUF4184 family protein [Planctomycetota bacterium]
MPLTPAHAAAVIPFCRWNRYFWLSPLVIGSMAPDFAYFVFPPLSLRQFGHTPLGLVIFCIPAGLAVLYAFHRFFKRPLALLLPRPIRAKLWPHCGHYPLLPLRRLVWIGTLIFLGAVTHVVWDGFTHEDSWAVHDYPQMKAVVVTIAGEEVHWAGFLQYASSLFGLGLLAWWSWQWYHLAPVGRESADSTFLWRAGPAIATAMIAFGAGVGIVCGLAHAANTPGPFSVREFFTAAFITGIDAFGLALLVFVAGVNMRVGGAAWEASEAGQQPLLRDLGDYSRRQKQPD